MKRNNPHLLKSPSLFAMFCLSYIPLFLLLIIKVCVGNSQYLNFGGFHKNSILVFLEKFGFTAVLIFLGLYGIIGTRVTMKNIKKKESNAFPVTISSINPKNEEALSYLGSYVIPLLIQGEIGIFECASFTILFLLYYRLYSTSSLILINPILNLKYGLYDIEYYHSNDTTKLKSCKVIANQQWLEEGDEIKILKLSHKLFFAY